MSMMASNLSSTVGWTTGVCWSMSSIPGRDFRWPNPVGGTGRLISARKEGRWVRHVRAEPKENASPGLPLMPVAYTARGDGHDPETGQSAAAASSRSRAARSPGGTLGVAVPGAGSESRGRGEVDRGDQPPAAGMFTRTKPGSHADIAYPGASGPPRRVGKSTDTGTCRRPLRLVYRMMIPPTLHQPAHRRMYRPARAPAASGPGQSPTCRHPPHFGDQCQTATSPRSVCVYAGGRVGLPGVGAFDCDVLVVWVATGGRSYSQAFRWLRDQPLTSRSRFDATNSASRRLAVFRGMPSIASAWRAESPTGRLCFARRSRMRVRRRSACSSGEEMGGTLLSARGGVLAEGVRGVA